MNFASLKRTQRIVFLFAVIITPVHADDIAEDLANLGFVEWQRSPDLDDRYSPPIKTPQAVSIPDYYFVENKRTLVVRKATDKEIDRERVVFDAGSFNYIGIDRGEFGGGLYVGEVKDENLLLRGNISALMSVGDDLYIFSGLCHMGLSGGAVHVIRDYRRPSPPTRITLLPDAPMVVSRDTHWSDRTSFAIAGCNGLMVFVPDTRLEIAIYPVLWGYPIALVEYKDHYVIGISDGVAVLNKKSFRPQLRYFVPK